MQFTINKIPPTYNQHFKVNFNLKQIYLTKEAREFKKLVKLITPNMSYKDNSLFEIIIKIHNNWYCKNGNIKKQDIQNMDKLLIDAVCEKLAFDDSRIWKVTLEKIQDEVNQLTEIEINER